MEYCYKKPLSFKPISLENLLQGQEGVYIRTSHSSNSYNIKKPLFLEDPDQCGFLKEVHHRKIHYGNSFVLSIKNVRLIGVCTYITENKEWFNDQNYFDDNQFILDLDMLEDYNNHYNNGWTRFQPTDTKGLFKKAINDRPEIYIRGKTLVLCSQEPDVFGSWLFRFLPKLNAAIQMQLPFDQILIEPHEKLLEYIELLGIDPAIIVKHNRNYCYKLEHAIIPSLQNSLLYLDEESQNFYNQLRQKYGEPSSNDNKLFISRLKHITVSLNYRVLMNEKELEMALIKEGFKSIFPELLSVKEQIRTFSSASVIVGPSGSALFNCVYCHPGTPVIDIESQPFHLDNHAALFSSYGVKYGFFAGRPDPSDTRLIHRNWTVIIPALIQCIKKFTK